MRGRKPWWRTAVGEERMNRIKVPLESLRRWPVLAAIALNLIPLAGVIFWGWSAFALIVLYWLENIVIGVRTLASMAANALVSGGVSWIAAAFFGTFFIFHYGLFCYGHGVFVMVLFSGPAGGGFYGESIIDLVGAVRGLLASQSNLVIGLVSIIVWQGVQLALFLGRGEAARTNPLELMGAPYPRIIVLHLAIIFGGLLLMMLNQPLGGLIVLTLVKMAADVSEARKQELKPPVGAPVQGAANQA